MSKPAYTQCSVCNTYVEIDSKVDNYFCSECKKTRKVNGVIETWNMKSGLMDKIQAQAQLKRQYSKLSSGTLLKGCDVDEETCETALENLDSAIGIGEKLIKSSSLDQMNKRKAEEYTYSAYAERAYVLARLDRRDEAKESAEIAQENLQKPINWLDELLEMLGSD